jgi:hypothetical protein
MDQEEKRDVPMHLPRSQEVLPFGITNEESLAEGPTDREDLMRPTSSSTRSHENEKRESADQQSTSKSASSPRDAKEWASHRALNATSLGSLGEISSASTDVTFSSEGDIERYSAAHVTIPADDLEVIVHDTQVLFLRYLSAAVEDIECSYKCTTSWKFQSQSQRQQRKQALHLRVQRKLLHTAPHKMSGRAVRR